MIFGILFFILLWVGVFHVLPAYVDELNCRREADRRKRGLPAMETWEEMLAAQDQRFIRHRRL